MSTFHLVIVMIISIVPTLVHTVCKFFNVHYRIYLLSCFTDITVHPQSVNTTLNSTVIFTCEAVADEITFRVNDMSATFVNVINKGFTQQSTMSLSGGKLRRVLLAKALQDNNNTNISCKAVNSEIIYSDIAVLRIQGELML